MLISRKKLMIQSQIDQNAERGLQSTKFKAQVGRGKEIEFAKNYDTVAPRNLRELYEEFLTEGSVCARSEAKLRG